MNLTLMLRSIGIFTATLLVAGADCTIDPPDTLTVLDHNDTLARGNGDEVAIGRILFHATFGDPASTEVIVDDRLDELGSDLSEGETITLPEDLVRVGQLDFGGVPIVDWQDDIVARNAPVAISGSIVVALELDRHGLGKARSSIAERVEKLRDALDFFIAGPNGNLIGLPDAVKLETVALAIYCVQAVQAGSELSSDCPVHPDHPEWSDGDGGSGRKRLIGHDLIGIGGVLSLNVVPADFDAKLALIRLALLARGLPLETVPPCDDDPEAEPSLVLCAAEDRPISIHFKGNDAHWRLDTHVISPP